MQSEQERFRVLSQEGPVKEFRVSCVRRYQVTEWADYRGGGAGTRVLAAGLTLKQANEIAEAFGKANPDALVNTVDSHEEVSVTPA
jgi:hypothetical protein